MLRFGLLLLTLVLAVDPLLPAQTGVIAGNDSGVRSRLVPPLVSPRPFSIDEKGVGAGLPIEFLSSDRMSVADRTLAADAESTIGGKAAFSGYVLTQGRWSYRQILCPALPGHLFLQYLSDNGAQDVSVFSVAIPRAGAGRVRIIPILRRSYSLFSPAPINALTISAFNHIRAEEPSGQSSDWLGAGLCYAALAGAHPQLASPKDVLAEHQIMPTLSVMMEIPSNGGEVIRFVDAAASPYPMEWSLTFSSKGKLIKAAHSRAPMIGSKPVPPGTESIKMHPVAANSQD